jgi:cytochrome c-type biogenesis protein CcmH/NrfG
LAPFFTSPYIASTSLTPLRGSIRSARCASENYLGQQCEAPVLFLRSADPAARSMIHPMRRDYLLFLLVGFAVGFGVVYFWTKQRAPQIVQARPVPLVPGAASQTRMPPPPPVDTARLNQLQAAVKENPRDFDALVELGNMSYDQRNFQEAVNWYAKALEVRPDSVNVRSDMGTAKFYMERVDEAMTDFVDALKVDPRHPQTLFNLGVAYLHGKNDPQKAIEQWERLLALNPNYPQAGLVKEQIDLVKEQMNK